MQVRMTTGFCVSQYMPQGAQHVSAMLRVAAFVRALAASASVNSSHPFAERRSLGPPATPHVRTS